MCLDLAPKPRYQTVGPFLLHLTPTGTQDSHTFVQTSGVGAPDIRTQVCPVLGPQVWIRTKLLLDLNLRDVYALMPKRTVKQKQATVNTRHFCLLGRTGEVKGHGVGSGCGLCRNLTTN